MVERLTYTVPEVAHALGISRSLAYRLANDGDLGQVVRLGRRVLIPRENVERLLPGSAAARLRVLEERAS